MKENKVPTLTGGKLRKMRMAKGITQEAIAHAIGEQQYKVSVWERGHAKIPTDKAAMIFAFLEGASKSTVWRRGEETRKRARGNAPVALTGERCSWASRSFCDSCRNAYADRCRFFATCKPEGLHGLKYKEHTRVIGGTGKAERLIVITDCVHFEEEMERRGDLGIGEFDYLVRKLERERKKEKR